MELTKENYQTIQTEFKDIINRCENTFQNNGVHAPDFVFFASAAHGIINRIMNLECHPTLVMMHQAIANTVNSLRSRISNSQDQTSVSSRTPKEFFEALLQNLKDLSKAFDDKDDEAIRKTLEKFASLEYASTGNGYYLYLRGKLKI